MRYLPMILGAALMSVGLPTVSSQAHAAMPVPSQDRSAVADSRSRRPATTIAAAATILMATTGPYYRPFGYYRPYGYYGWYGHPYRWRY